jgi:hypothetical protein
MAIMSVKFRISEIVVSEFVKSLNKYNYIISYWTLESQLQQALEVESGDHDASLQLSPGNLK